MKTAALYARVSSERQKEEQTIASQTEALKEYAAANGYMVAPIREAQSFIESGGSIPTDSTTRSKSFC
jgi:DNA invertase Pin-like site-specific DNA recombinase